MRQHKAVPVRGPRASNVVSVSLKVFEGIDTPLSLSCYLLLKNGEYDQLLRKKVRSTDYNDPLAFRRDYQAVSLLSKASFFRVASIDRRQTAIEKFWSAENDCREANERLRLYSCGQLMPNSLAIHGVLHRAREFIRRVLGDEPSRSKWSRSFRPRFGPGVTTSARGRNLTHAQKYKSRIDVTPRLYPYIHDLFGVRLGGRDVQLKAANRVTFVPKNALTDRTIAVEPHGNIYAQLGIGRMIRDALRHHGLNLDTQHEYNRWLASIAMDARLATVDLSSASDTLCRELVWLLLPEGWADLLDVVRSPYGELGGVEFEYQKFSSMGNGTTFELETLIFWALARATGSRDALTSAFGDDIIVEQHCADLLIETLAFCGFTVNVQKSFTSGSFFESCGSDFHSNVNVRPFFWKELEPSLWFKMGNDILRYASFDGAIAPEVAMLPAWLRVLSLVPSRLRLGVPVGLGDCGFIVPMDHNLVKARWVSSRNALDLTVLRFRPSPVPVWDDEGGLLAALDGHPTDLRQPGHHVPRDAGVFGVGAITFSPHFGGWRHLGSW